MKVIAVCIAFVVSIAAAFAGGAYFSVRYFVNPIIEKSTWFEREMFLSQVAALAGMQRGTNQEALVYLRARNGYSLSMLASDEAELKKLKKSPILLESVAMACEDIRKNSNDPTTTGAQKNSAGEACNTLLSKPEPAAK